MAADLPVAAAGALAPRWHGRLRLRYRREGARTVAHDLHEGPLRVLRPLYPEGEDVCHHVMVHPPGGLVGGDRLDIDLRLAPGTHALLTTPGATRFYRSNGAPAGQQVEAVVGAGARLEWLPAETVAYSGCQAESRLRCTLEPGAQMIGSEVLALGLPASGQAYTQGCLRLHLEVSGHWLERGLIDAADHRLLDSPLGLGGRRALATLWFASGDALPPAAVEALLAAARAGADAAGTLGAEGALVQGATAPSDHVVVLRLLAPRAEPALQRLRAVWADWRRLMWQRAPEPPRVWRT